MLVYLGLGSNKGDRRALLKKAVELLKQKTTVQKISSVYETPAHLPEKFSKEWNRPFLNTALKAEWGGSLEELLSLTQSVEQKLGRQPSSPRWSPREMDIDILAVKGRPVQAAGLTVPHPCLKKRDFVLSPLRDIDPSFEVDGESVLSLSRSLREKSPAWMDIVNLTPDSFSDGGEFFCSFESRKNFQKLEQKIQNNIQYCVQWMDVGGCSTRPGADFVSAPEEWKRVKPFFQVFKNFSNSFIKVSIDTFQAEAAQKALDEGASAVNDVSGLSSRSMLKVIQNSSCDYILMHSLSVPADKEKTIDADKDVIQEISDWLEKKLDLLEKSRIDLSRVIFDPGIGFGKTAQQSLELIQRFEEFYKYPVRLMLGHSRKSFMSIFSKRPASERSLSSLGVSLQTAQRGADIIRVHKAYEHSQAWLACKHASL